MSEVIWYVYALVLVVVVSLGSYVLLGDHYYEPRRQSRFEVFFGFQPLGRWEPKEDRAKQRSEHQVDVERVLRFLADADGSVKDSALWLRCRQLLLEATRLAESFGYRVTSYEPLSPSQMEPYVLTK